MGAMKSIAVQAKDAAGAVTFDQIIQGKKHKSELLLEALRSLQGREGWIRYQTIGARSWAVYQALAGGQEARHVPGANWETLAHS